MGAPAESPLRKRLKAICGLANPAEIGFDKVTAGLVTKFNAKPFMCKTSGVYHGGGGTVTAKDGMGGYAAGAQYFGVEIDVHRWGKLALNGFNSVKAHIQHMKMRFGALIEAVGDDEMPEQMLVCAYMSQLSSAICPQLPEQALRAATYESPLQC